MRKIFVSSIDKITSRKERGTLIFSYTRWWWWSWVVWSIHAYNCWGWGMDVIFPFMNLQNMGMTKAPRWRKVQITILTSFNVLSILLESKRKKVRGETRKKQRTWRNELQEHELRTPWGIVHSWIGWNIVPKKLEPWGIVHSWIGWNIVPKKTRTMRNCSFLNWMEFCSKKLEPRGIVHSWIGWNIVPKKLEPWGIVHSWIGWNIVPKKLEPMEMCFNVLIHMNMKTFDQRGSWPSSQQQSMKMCMELEYNANMNDFRRRLNTWYPWEEGICAISTPINSTLVWVGWKGGGVAYLGMTHS